jgi:hypothetical protein
MSAVRLPFINGLNVTLIKQLAPEATLLPQVLVSVKSPASAQVEQTFQCLSGETLCGLLAETITHVPDVEVDGMWRDVGMKERGARINPSFTASIIHIAYSPLGSELVKCWPRNSRHRDKRR